VEDDAENALQDLAAHEHGEPGREEADDDHKQGIVPSGCWPFNKPLKS
jgi:hypothetical protein